MAKQKKQIKKKFFTASVPILNKEIELYGIDIKSFDKQFVKIDLANELKGKGAHLRLKIEADTTAVCHPVELKLISSYLRRVMRKGVDYSEDSFITECKDHKIRIKPFMITRNRVTKRVLRGLRNKAKEDLEKYVKDKTFDKIVADVISGKVQRELMLSLRKVYPLSLFEIKFIGIDDRVEYSEANEIEEEKND